jgi:YD repeat-containing protein
MAYDAGGRLTSSTDRDGRVRNISYDALGRETGETWSGTGVTPNTLTYTYDAAGNRLTSADANGAYTMAYDALNRMTSQQSPFNLTQTYVYDAAGDRTRVYDSLGGTQVSYYDATGRLTTRTQGGTGQTPVRTDLTYTPDGQVATQTGTATAAQDLADEVKGNPHYLAGYGDALKAVTRFLEESRHLWDVPA